ncbi:trna pseudouridine synthase pus10 [Stylonychia lemnae]|uniref:tRNA pseudouridine(55) synthase n=1 Tax=Stylonychia lemnae TaxID=5949 RepID=A0A077ZZG9_STYLE|nr:trna pseudouridine synthase pus10 [Stylonychia lemnae]|eukprot:CDW74628.1 trna pseudouridine synthase pus10 [Stylonychia lemnae]
MENQNSTTPIPQPIQLDYGIQEAIKFYQGLDAPSKQFFDEYHSKNICIRCILMLFRVNNLQMYRIKDYQILIRELQLQANTLTYCQIGNVCKICLGVNQYCDLDDRIDILVQKIKEQKFEFRDFKITFSISIVAYINKMIYISDAEDKLGIRFPFSTKEYNRNSLDFKEVYKWIVSPILVRKLDVSANLDGSFLINVNFCNRDQNALDNPDSEAAIIDKLQNDLNELGISKVKNQYGSKWKNKKNKKDDKEEEKQQVKSQMGAEQILVLLSKTPLSLMMELSIVRDGTNYTLNLLRQLSVECTQDSLLLYGRYIKHSREVSQTPWLIEARDIGREDIDVRMLGIGRPFVLEFINPKNIISCLNHMPELQKYTTSDVVYCHDFQIVDKRFFDELKDIENSKAKAYCCVVWIQRKITKKELEKRLNCLLNIEIKQTTPIRVLHRRSLMVRDKLIYKVHAEYINQHYFVLHVLASAGTYIKEFVHGDLGRTVPSIGSLLESEADILQLDVTQVYDSVHNIDLTKEDWHKIQYIDRE